MIIKFKIKTCNKNLQMIWLKSLIMMTMNDILIIFYKNIKIIIDLYFLKYI